MGMIANYQEITDAELERLESCEDIFEAVEEMQENDARELCDIDKMWDALHFLLTGRSASKPIEDNLISESIIGSFGISEDEFITGIHADRVNKIAKALQEIDFTKYMENFSMHKFAKNDIYPAIWEYQEEEDMIKEDLKISFESLKKFYQNMAEKGCGVLISIY